MVKDRTNQRIMMLNLSILYDIKEIERAKDMVKTYMTAQRVLRNTLKEHPGLNPYSKLKIGRQIKRNKTIINGLSAYIVDLRSQMKSMQKIHPLNNKKKDDTTKE